MKINQYLKEHPKSRLMTGYGKGYYWAYVIGGKDSKQIVSKKFKNKEYDLLMIRLLTVDVGEKEIKNAKRNSL